MYTPLRTVLPRLARQAAPQLHRTHTHTRPLSKPALAQSTSPLAPIGVAAALASDPTAPAPARAKIFDEFSLADRVGIVSGGNRGLGLEMALALCEAGARAVYCFDLPASPSDEFTRTRAYAARLPRGGARLEYVCADVRDQRGVWARAAEVGDREGRVDVCVAAAGVLRAHTDCLEYPGEQFREVYGVNVDGVLWTAQAAGRQMRRFGRGGSIVLVASMSGSVTNKVGVGCVVGMTAAYLDTQPHLLEKWSSLNPMGRIGRPDELRGVITWLASDASSFCTGSEYVPLFCAKHNLTPLSILVSGGHHAW
ncbi:hypothetical protein C0992_001701 [Termitomyces sp. T32_za158]|nr:hypothetical protein C0992_001701 [Termitomyces sp. T32_za158]